MYLKSWGFGCPPLDLLAPHSDPIRLADFVQRARQNGQGGTNDQDCSDLGGTKFGGGWFGKFGGYIPLMDT